MACSTVNFTFTFTSIQEYMDWRRHLNFIENFLAVNLGLLNYKINRRTALKIRIVSSRLVSSRLVSSRLVSKMFAAVSVHWNASAIRQVNSGVRGSYLSINAFQLTLFREYLYTRNQNWVTSVHKIPLLFRFSVFCYGIVIVAVAGFVYQVVGRLYWNGSYWNRMNYRGLDSSSSG